ncbi:endoplasmic reticulum-Golgi intermediate compartment protein 3-like [Oryza brachyantha]|uniref:Endoplasmic reticulum vesicle transporter C-terminal domain-containing protein n=1 Tax=Oryza brachyantha TaxID=4533 RepID=J3M8C7_ORYBR|nr:endoplasmic reticulum-Golgi intermediate compartment protein 3-like [Oryza brachyantha]
MDGFLQKLKGLDAYPKVNEDFYKRTLSGGVVTLVASVVMLLLFVSETRSYFYSATETKLVVDTSRGERLRVNFDITFPSVPCTLLSVDTVDISGEQHHDIRHDIEKKRLDAHGNVIEARKEGIGGAKIESPLQKHGGRLSKGEEYCGTCYGAEESDEQCCNSCDEVREAYKKKGWALTNPDLIDQCTREDFVERVKTQQGEGCNVHGFLDVSKVAGNFHFAPGKGFYQSNINVPELSVLEQGFNITHKINKLSFGTEFPGVVNPLNGAQWTQPASDGTYQYFIKVVPTIYTDLRGRKIHSNQFSVTEHFRDGNVRPKPQPGVFFFYDFSPIKVIFTEENRSLLHYLTNLCAIVGGVFTVSGIIDSFIYHGQKALKKKMELGKYR